MPIGPLDTAFAPSNTRDQNPMAQQGQDPILAGLMQQAQGLPPRPSKLRQKKKLAKPEASQIRATANRDQDRYRIVIERMSRDVSLYRQHAGGRPKSFHPSLDQEVRSSQLSTLVNKLANMMGGMDQIISVPWDTVPEEKAAQRIEDALYQQRKLAKRQHTRDAGGENLQRMEFFYLLLHGRYAKRILPDSSDLRFPYADLLCDPSTCFPTFGGPKKGLIRMVRKFSATMGEIISTYSMSDPNIERRLLREFGYDTNTAAGEWWNIEGEVIEYWDETWHYVSYRNVDVVPVMEHGLRRIPYVYTMAVGEPHGMQTPGGYYMQYNELYAAYLPQLVGYQSDLAEKGVSVFHYLVNTHKLQEMLYTLLFSEVEKSTDPATIEYQMPHLQGKDNPPLQTKRGKSNKRQLNMEKIEPVPTSPRPTDFSPLMSGLQQQFMEGSISPAMFGAEQGSNITGSGMDTMIQMAKDMVMPYITAWEMAQALEHEIRLEQYVDELSGIMTLSAPGLDPYGTSSGEIQEMSLEDVEMVGTFVEVEAAGMTDQNEAQKIAYLGQGVQAGFFSQRYAMKKLQIKNQNAMFGEIIAEKAAQHPEMMENIIIPKVLIESGQEDQADMWLEMVVAPKLMMMGQGGAAPGGGGMMGAAGGGGSQAVPVPPGQPVDQSAGGRTFGS